MGWLTLLVEPIKLWFETRKQKAAAKAARDIAVLNNQARLAQDEQSHNHDWEMANLADKDKGLRYVSYSMFALPILITVIYPQHGQEIFTNLDLVPDWWVKTFISINGGVWGIVELKRVAPALISAIKGAVKGG
ncbi:hypothetical protein [Shewanella psychrotolerans]|uniref:hypothetical protein n=1 Tax=Shewanella psychrotolerans TaxID=2864206 RepID=UPI001C65FC1D|nr:hypothetical protein [Shewanella psychrotolerans]QYK03122.1 hypothetical protein K0I62_09480 [Shewanella psychrotolerans]